MMSNASSVAGLLAKKYGFINKNHKGTEAKNEPEGVQQKQSKSEVKTNDTLPGKLSLLSDLQTSDWHFTLTASLKLKTYYLLK